MLLVIQVEKPGFEPRSHAVQTRQVPYYAHIPMLRLFCRLLGQSPTLTRPTGRKWYRMPRQDSNPRRRGVETLRSVH